MKTTINNKRLKPMTLLKKNKLKSLLKQTIKSGNIKKYSNLKRYLIKKNRDIKKIENKLVKTKIELQNQQYNLLILNMFLGFVIILFIYLNFYKLALIGFGYLLIKNNSFIKETFDVYLIQKDHFNKYYKKKFSVFFYVLPLIGFFSGLGVLYTVHLLNNIYLEIVSDKVHLFPYKHEIQSLQLLFIVLVIIFFCCLIIDFGITIYIIQKANPPIDRSWGYFIMAGRILGVTTLVVSFTALACSVIGEAPEPSAASNVINTKTPLGRGWDAEPEDIYTKKAFSKLQQFTGRQLLLDKLSELNIGENPRIVTINTYQKLLEDPEIINKVRNAPNISNEELNQMGFKTLPELSGSTIKQSVKSKFGYLGEKINSGIKFLVNMFKRWW